MLESRQFWTEVHHPHQKHQQHQSQQSAKVENVPANKKAELHNCAGNMVAKSMYQLKGDICATNSEEK